MKDVIRHVSHVSGSIHAGTPREEVDHLLIELNSQFQVGGTDATIFSLLAICEVVLSALENLTDIVENELKH